MTTHLSSDTQPFDAYQQVQAMLDGVPDFAALHAAVELNVFETLACEPMTSLQLAQACGADPAAMDRLTGWLHARGLITGGPDGYRLTESGHVLTAEASPSLRHAVLVTGSAYWQGAIGRLTDTIRRGHPTHPEGLPVYEYLACTPELAYQFDRFMTARSTAVGRNLAALKEWAGVRLVADLGGGLGGVLAALVHAHPHLRGILAERADVTARAHAYLKEQGLLGRIQIIAADIFEDVPRGAQRYLLSSILHNHSDDACIRLLTRVRQALQGGPGGQVWIVEGMLPRRPGTASPWHSTDIRMMSLFQGGQVRRASHLRQLAEHAGLSILRTRRLPSGQTLLTAQLTPEQEG